MNCYGIASKVKFVKKPYSDEYIADLKKESQKTTQPGWSEQINYANKSNFFLKTDDKCKHIDEFVNKINELHSQKAGYYNKYMKYKHKYIILSKTMK